MLKIIEERWVNAILNYLYTRPYSEVSEVIPVLKTLPNAEPLVLPAEEGGASA